MKDSAGTPWMPTGQVAHELGFSIPWVRKQIDEGRLAARQYRSGGRRALRVHRDDLERFVDLFMTV
jgi:excisionase family DNA binding protein